MRKNPISRRTFLCTSGALLLRSATAHANEGKSEVVEINTPQLFEEGEPSLEAEFQVTRRRPDGQLEIGHVRIGQLPDEKNALPSQLLGRAGEVGSTDMENRGQRGRTASPSTRERRDPTT